MLFNRRSIISGLAAGIASAMPACALDDAPLKVRAARRGLVFGCAVQNQALRRDPAYAAAVRKDCAMVTPEWEMKWGAIERVRHAPDYGPADWIFNFAKQSNMAVRGHTIVWQNNLPNWATPALAAPGGKIVLQTHIREIVGHFAGRVAQWDVVNEALYPKNGIPGGIANTILYKSFGKSYISDAFVIARQSDAKAQLFYNDENFFYDDPDHAARRRSLLALLDWLKAQNAPIDGIGIESHLVAAGPRFDEGLFRSFLHEVAAHGVKIMITELDVNDKTLGANVAERDRIVADHARRYLDVALDEKAVIGVVTWGLSDRYTWLGKSTRWGRTDGEPTRPLPLDSGFSRKPLWYAIAAAIDGAPDRRA